MYEITIDSERFKGKRTLLQHKMVNQVSMIHHCSGKPREVLNQDPLFLPQYPCCNQDTSVIVRTPL